MRRTIFYFAVAFNTTLALGVTILLVLLRSPDAGAKKQESATAPLP